MSILQAAVLGLIQGLAEFLPISSSGHLVLARILMGLPDTDPLVFEIVVHVGTLAAVIIVFYKDVWNMLKSPLTRLLLFFIAAGIPAVVVKVLVSTTVALIVYAVTLLAIIIAMRQRVWATIISPQSKQVLLLIIATIPAVLVTLLFEDFIEEAFGGSYLGIGFIMTALFLVFSEVFRPKNPRKFKDMTAKDAGIMGVMQAIALVPGISRSGSTISGGLVSGLNRQLATRFAFLMSIPAILGSVVFKIKDLLAGAESLGIPQLAVGALVAGVSGYLAIKFMLHIVRKHKLYGFAVYVAILGILILLDQYIFNMFFTNPPF